VNPTNKQKETHLINWKQMASPHSSTPSSHHGCAQKQLLDRWSGMSKRAEIKIKPKSLKETKLVPICTRAACQPQREEMREKAVLFLAGC